jgi:hypothetical protein
VLDKDNEPTGKCQSGSERAVKSRQSGTYRLLTVSSADLPIGYLWPAVNRGLSSVESKAVAFRSA